MNKKKVQTILNILVITFAIISVATSVFAAKGELISPSSVTPVAPESKTIETTGNQIVGILQTVGVILSVVVLIIIGIKYMMGSAEEKAEYKKTFIPYVVGAALIFAASVFAQGIYDLVISITGSK